MCLLVFRNDGNILVDFNIPQANNKAFLGNLKRISKLLYDDNLLKTTANFIV